MTMRKLSDIAKTIRSKNAGIDKITFDVIFAERADYDLVDVFQIEAESRRQPSLRSGRLLRLRRQHEETAIGESVRGQFTELLRRVVKRIK